MASPSFAGSFPAPPLEDLAFLTAACRTAFLALSAPLDFLIHFFEGCWVDRLLSVVDVRLGVTTVGLPGMGVQT